MEPHRDTKLNIKTRVVQSCDLTAKSRLERLNNGDFRDIII